MLDIRSERAAANRRSIPRFIFTESFKVSFGSTVLRMDAYNLSVGGISGSILGIGNVPEKMTVEVYIRNFRPVMGRVRWARGREIGITFTEDLANHPQIRALVKCIESGDVGGFETPL